MNYKELEKLNINNYKKIYYKGNYYFNVSMSFDIETSSFYTDVRYNKNITNKIAKTYNNKDSKYLEKKSIMYIWQFAIDNNVYIGRTWNEFIEFTNILKSKFNLNEKNYIIIYVHNLSYEFQFIRKWLNILDIFADSERSIIECKTVDGLMFKCSYRLSGMKLETLANNLTTHKIKKLVGDLDYTLIRNSNTILSDSEIAYCVNDVLIVTSYINECIETYGNITKIPLTNTSKVRRYVRKECFKNKKYRFLIEKLTIDKLEYKQLQRCFSGGFTHSNAMYTDVICENVTSYDFTSSYPTVMCSELYPMSKGVNIDVSDITIEKFNYYLKNYCCMFDIEFTNIKNKVNFENIISVSKCFNLKNCIKNNGRVVTADSLTITINEVDFFNIELFYTWDSFKIGNLIIYKKGFLPKEFILSILNLYKDKTELKDVDGKETEYLLKKGMLNSCYGMSVTNIIRDLIGYENNEYTFTTADLNNELEKYNTDKNRFLFYTWGVWVTSYARRNLFNGIYNIGNDYIYSDTDSIKLFNADKHKKYFENYNNEIIKKLYFVCDYYNIDKSLISPKNNKGKIKQLGIWDYDGFYKRFKTLGAKRYLIETIDNKHILTCAGVSKKAIKYIEQNYKGDVFNAFINGMYIDCEHTYKMTHTYNDNEIKGSVIDYKGVSADYYEKSFIHLENTDFTLSMTDLYIDYILNIKNNFTIIK